MASSTSPPSSTRVTSGGRRGRRGGRRASHPAVSLRLRGRGAWRAAPSVPSAMKALATCQGSATRCFGASETRSS
eukprot:8398011-Alexandrium_andersonii.AAC.1